MRNSLVLVILLAGAAGAAERTVAIRPDGVFLQDGIPIFPLGFVKGPPPDGRTPSGESAYAELKTNGAVFQRCGSLPKRWGPDAEAELDYWMRRSAEAGISCAIYIPDLAAPAEQAAQDELRRVVAKYRSHPGLFVWKAADEPEWGKVPVEHTQRFYDIVHELDSGHPVWLTQAPRGTIESLKRYDGSYDVAAIDIYPIGYPPGMHSHLPNKSLSVVGDYANWLREITGMRKPFWMVLQICWSGVARPGKTLRFPTFAEERYMSYQSIINGARGLLYFGGNVEAGWSERDRPLQWNWSFYYGVLKPLLREFHPSGPLHPALVAPESKLPVRVEGGEGIEFTVRETPSHIYLLAAKREGATVQVTFRGLPEAEASGEVLFEDPRKVTVSAGGFSDWFGPNEVHVYRFARRP
ncbi:MAG: hypothetical protein HYS04_12325 [Acidobacteria bacterium]|nr:hypothetical protein [Acidobacteriota bacterium]